MAVFPYTRRSRQPIAMRTGTGIPQPSTPAKLNQWRTCFRNQQGSRNLGVEKQKRIGGQCATARLYMHILYRSTHATTHKQHACTAYNQPLAACDQTKPASGCQMAGAAAMAHARSCHAPSHKQGVFGPASTIKRPTEHPLQSETP